MPAFGSVSAAFGCQEHGTLYQLGAAPSCSSVRCREPMVSPDTKSASRSHASLSDHRCTPPHAGQAIGAVIAMWLKSATSHLIPVGTAVSAVGHRTITMYGCFGTAQSLRV